MARTWLGKPLRELTEQELEELAGQLAAELPENDPMALAVRDNLRRQRGRATEGR